MLSFLICYIANLPVHDQLNERLEKARKAGDKEEEKHLLMKKAAAGQDAATEPEQV